MKLIKDNIRELVDKYLRYHPDATDSKQQIVLRLACALVTLHQAEKEYIDKPFVITIKATPMNSMHITM